MPLDLALVELILSKLGVTYGMKFHAQYRAYDPETVQRNWAQELAGLTSEGVARGLANLPADDPPNVLQFRRLCAAQVKRDEHLALPAPDVRSMAPEFRGQMRAVVAGLRGNLARGRFAWAEAMRARELAGDKTITQFYREAWRATLHKGPSKGE